MLSDGHRLSHASCCWNGRSGRCFALAWTPILTSRLPPLSLPDLAVSRNPIYVFATVVYVGIAFA